MVVSLRSAVLMLLLATATQMANAQVQTVTKLPFQTTIEAIAADGLDVPRHRLELVDKNGWLVVTLTAEPDELEWQIVLARLNADIQPVISVHPQLPMFTVQYGAWFIRESLGRLRVYREPKDITDDRWTRIIAPPIGDRLSTAGSLAVMEEGDWCWACTSPRFDQENFDTRIRFQHKSLNDGHGSMMFADGRFAEVFCGNARCHDEGDLLVASRITGYGARALLDTAATKARLVGAPMPEITGMKVGQNELPKPQDLHGRVILVSFWATWCGPCVAKLPEIAELQRKCRARGLVVIGVHASQNADGLANFVDDHPLEFPIVLDDGGTEKRYAVTQYPTYFLVDRRGNVMFAAHSTPPSEAMISAALDAASETQAELDGP